MNKYNLIALSCLALGSSLLNAGLIDVKVKITAAVQNCIGGEGSTIECKQVVNAIGDPASIPLKELTIQPLDLSKPSADLALPVTPGTRTAYSFVPSSGDLAGKTVYLVFENVEQRRGTKDFGKQVNKMYRHVLGVDKPDVWIEVGSVDIEKLSWPFELNVNGTLTSQNEKFFLGKGTISKTAPAS